MKKRGFAVVSGFVDKNINLPQRKTAYSAGYDIEAAESVTIKPQATAIIPTGLKAYMQENEFLAIYIRSSLAKKKKLSLLNSVGIIDADYYDNEDNEGHIGILVYNNGDDTVSIEKGERVAQGIFQPYLLADDDAADGKRRGGFGSTGS